MKTCCPPDIAGGAGTTFISAAKEPEREESIQEMCAAIRNAGRAGVRGLNYNFCPIPHQRTPQSTGRGGTSQSTFHLAEYDQEQRYPVGELSRDEVYARAQYMLERIIPVAEEAGVQMACHLCAPYPPPPTTHAAVESTRLATRTVYINGLTRHV